MSNDLGVSNPTGLPLGQRNSVSKLTKMRKIGENTHYVAITSLVIAVGLYHCIYINHDHR